MLNTMQHRLSATLSLYYREGKRCRQSRAFSFYRRRNHGWPYRFNRKSRQNYTMDRTRRTREVNGTILEVGSSRTVETVTRFTTTFPCSFRFHDVTANFPGKFPIFTCKRRFNKTSNATNFEESTS